MDFEQDLEQSQLTESVARYLEREYGFDERAKILRAEAACSDKAWADFAELGLLGLPLPQDYEGFGWGATGMMGVMQALGAALVLEQGDCTNASVRQA